MSALHSDLTVTWYLLLALVLLLTVLLDGFSLGVGILSLFVSREKERGLMMVSLGSIWHINQTWLVVLGALLFGAFPLVYGLVLSALYIPVALMLLGFMFRGVSLEYYDYADNKRLWSLSFGLGSLAAALAQGFALGTLLEGLPVVAGRFAGGPWLWLSPFSSLAALCLLGAYCLCGAAWLVFKTTGDLQAKARQGARAAAFFLLLAAPALLIWAVDLHPYLQRQWLSWPGLLLTSLPLVLAVALFVIFIVYLSQGREGASLICALLLIAASLISLVASSFPVMVPPGLTVYQAAAGTASLKFMLVGIAVMLPVMLFYNAYQYWVFRGKVGAG
jgi:cytochrome d ubiquinol oxidase subunit II